MSKLHAALSLVDLGFYVFPLEENGKLPALPGSWQKHSTLDARIVKNWWVDAVTGWERDYNIGIDCGKSGLYVVDVDTKEGKHGARSFELLEMLYDFTATASVVTASGGRHLYYTAQGLGNTAGKALGVDIDTRGAGGYVAAPGSTINDKLYAWESAAPHQFAPLPDWIAQKVVASKVSSSSKKGSVLSEDRKEDIARAAHWLTTAAPLAIEGAHGDQTTFTVAAQVKDFGVSQEECLNLLLDNWNDRCSPPWDIEDLQRKVENAYRYGGNAVGRASAHADFGIVMPEISEDFMRPHLAPEPGDIPPRQWLFGSMILAKKVSMLVAPGGAGKSTFTISLALSKATGRDIMGINPLGRAPVWIWNNEDDMDEMNRRAVAVRRHFQISKDELFDNDARGGEAQPMLYMNSGEHRMLKIAQRTGNGILKPLDADQVIEAIKRRGVKLWIVDPFAETHPASENSNEEVLEVTKIYRSIAQAADCGVLLVHHDRKPDSSSSEGHAGNMHSARGASSLGGAVRIMMTLHTMSEKDAKDYGVAKEERKKHVRLDFAKANMTLESTEPRWFYRASERLGASLLDPEGESVGVLAPLSLSAKKNEPTDAQLALLHDVEALVDGSGDAGMAVKEIGEALVRDFPMHNGKNAANLAKAVRRLFDERPSVEGARGTLTFIEATGTTNRPKHYVRWAAKAE